MARTYSVRGVKTREYEALEAGASHDVDIADDAEYIASVMAPKKKKSELPATRYFYGQAPPAKPPFAEIVAALRSFKGLKSPRGSPAIFRERLSKESRINCPFQTCPMDAWNIDDLKRHIWGHLEVRKYADFVDRAMADYAGIMEKRDHLKEQAESAGKKMVDAGAEAVRLEAVQMRLEKECGINYDDYDPLTGAGGAADLDSVGNAIKRGGDALRKAQDSERVRRDSSRVAKRRCHL